MSRQAVQRYQNEIAQLIQYGGSSKETAIRGAFQSLLNEYCRQKDFLLVPELDYLTPKGKRVAPDGTVKDALRLSWGYWEAKDTDDDLDEEIQKKFAKGYPQDNILFEDSRTLVLIQAGSEAGRVLLDDDAATDRLLLQFLNYERPEVRTFRRAIEHFRQELPGVVDSLRKVIEKAEKTNVKFKSKLADFVVLGQNSINPEFGASEAREMMIQHILTEDIFNRVFDETQFHRENNIAHELEQVINTFFTGPTRRDTLERIRPFFDVINAQASGIASHKEKQKFLKVVYENFYKAYNPKGADRLGIVYTPNEVVRFMIESTDYLTYEHFGKTLGDKGVEILDPATGTGTFITELLEYLPKKNLAHKYQHELYANEVAILPYYIANLNIEYTYKQKMGDYAEFHNICFVDTLDNVGFQKTRRGQLGLSFGLGLENAQRIKRQNEREISVIIGNPPYNANQKSENDNNKNRKYPDVDKRVKETYINRSKAQKTKLYDPYVRFIRWASDRLDDKGVLAFITNSSFIHKGIFDGFRKSVGDEFSDIYLVDLGGDVRSNPKLSGTKHNVFGIQAGVAMAFFIKQPKKKNQLAKIYYAGRPALETAVDKLTFLHETKFRAVDFDRIKPDTKGNWLGLTNNDWESLVPLIDKETKGAKSIAGERALFRRYATGMSTNRDEWVIGMTAEAVSAKMQYFSKVFAKQEPSKEFDLSVKWSRNLKVKFKKGERESFDASRVKSFNYRPFNTHQLYHSSLFIDEAGLFGKSFGESHILNISGAGSSKPFQALATDRLTSLDFLEKTQCIPLYSYNKNGDKQPNITAWGLAQFRTHYGDISISGEQIFHYAYAVLHDPHYRAAYAQNLKQDFPRLPFYPDFAAWATAGRQLLALHLNYETAAPYPLTTVALAPKGHIKPRLKANPAEGSILLTDADALTGIPEAAWRYRLGNRSALDWVLEQYKERTPKDPTIRAHFDAYRFADLTTQFTDLLARVCTVSVETMRIVDELAAQSPLRAEA
ncbi:type ISP restriction/modification enzyme [Hymenobacter artigasi]|uniref:site-specific DNA-methyltransferase (adenine-specific) n=1 Tax=Hymenobacter artigasi TaxID=2719616 RepID=A0ABX1HIS1_9BACT|nr:type ISP restriction/modification enzyme [Hymenobacter artigasi]NKI90166.1 putative helicase [Hymenobacter artigasi]